MLTVHTHTYGPTRARVWPRVARTRSEWRASSPQKGRCPLICMARREGGGGGVAIIVVGSGGGGAEGGGLFEELKNRAGH